MTSWLRAAWQKLSESPRKLWQQLPDSPLIPRRLFAAWLGIFVVAALAGSYIVVASSLIPFRPYDVVSHRAIPEKGCPGTAVEVEITRVLHRPLFGKLSRYSVRTNWENLDTGQASPTEVFAGTYDGNEPFGLKTIDSPAFRSVPDRPGFWQLKSTLTIRGTVLGWPRIYTTSYDSQQIFESLPEGAPPCKLSTMP